MKRFFTFLLLAVAAMFSATATAHGDVNGDGEVNIADINSAIGIILDDLDYTPAIDVNNDGEINIADVNALIDIVLDNATTTPDDSEWVDLGLPSGTLWATMNIGASCPEDYGDYFAWGETTPKDYYDWSTYQWCNGSENTLSKYCTNSSYGNEGFTDNLTELDPEDDAATANWGAEWRMPSPEQIQELLNNCSRQWTKRNGVKGRLFTSKINGASLFLPAAGYRYGSNLNNAGSYGYYWLRVLNSSTPNYAYNLYFNSGSVAFNEIGYRINARSVRAVRVSQN